MKHQLSLQNILIWNVVEAVSSQSLGRHRVLSAFGRLRPHPSPVASPAAPPALSARPSLIQLRISESAHSLVQLAVTVHSLWVVCDSRLCLILYEVPPPTTPPFSRFNPPPPFTLFPTYLPTYLPTCNHTATLPLTCSLTHPLTRP